MYLQSSAMKKQRLSWGTSNIMMANQVPQVFLISYTTQPWANSTAGRGVGAELAHEKTNKKNWKRKIANIKRSISSVHLAHVNKSSSRNEVWESKGQSS